MNESFPPRPKLPDPSKIQQVARISPIGRCLSKALDVLVSQDRVHHHQPNEEESLLPSEPSSSDGSSTPTSEKEEDSSKRRWEDIDNFSKKRIRYTPSLQQSILTSFEHAVLQTQWHPPPSTSSSSSSSSSSSLTRRRIPPAAILEGTVQYYNRFHGQWRIVISNAILRPRVNFHVSPNPQHQYQHHHRNSTDRKRDLWHQSQTYSADPTNIIDLKGDNVELLAFDDE